MIADTLPVPLQSNHGHMPMGPLVCSEPVLVSGGEVVVVVSSGFEWRCELVGLDSPLEPVHTMGSATCV